MNPTEEKSPPPVIVRRQAVVIIHGIGEQRPMSTVRDFAAAISAIDSSKKLNRLTWVKPITVEDSFEHRRFTLPSTRNRPVTDVYELYWAHLFEQATHHTFLSFALRMLVRRNGSLPSRYRSLQRVIRTSLVLMSLIALYILYQQPTITATKAEVLVTVALALLLYPINYWLLNSLADAARYLDASPRNIEARNAVRARGVRFLRELHEGERRYDRIVLCGHSLGSVIGYDILNYFWYERHETYAPRVSYRQKLLKSFTSLTSGMSSTDYHRAQRMLFREQVANGMEWRITDFVTLGSPLAHADLLLADSNAFFEKLKLEGTISTCPPIPDATDGRIALKRTFDDAATGPRSVFIPRFNSVFAVVRWTNIWIKPHGLVIGDPISGRVGEIFGSGVRDIGVSLPLRNGWFQHGTYWTNDTDEGLPASLSALRQALVLDQKSY